jgi:hypothetical protein
MPDLFIKIDDYLCVTNFNLQNSTLFSRRKGGAHRLNGLLMASGPDFKDGLLHDEASIIDLAPTILHILGVPVPEDMDGRVLFDLLRNPGKIVYQKALTSSSVQQEYSETDEKILKKRLRDLGYMD